MSAAKRFRAAVEQAGGAATVADMLGCTRAYVYMIGRSRKPGRALAFKIERVLGVPAQAWDRVRA